MPEERLNKIMEELGVDDAEFVTKKLETETTGTALENLVQSGKDMVFAIWQRTINAPWLLLQAVFRLLIPQLFLRYASGPWLEEYALDHGLELFKGKFTQLTLDLTKDAGTPLTLNAGEVFYIVETDPRRYQVITEMVTEDADTDFQVVVEALAPTEDDYIYSAAYNAAVGLTWDSESPLPINSIQFNLTIYVVTGEDPELDDALRARIFSLRSLKAISLGINLFYQKLLMTVAGVNYALLESVDDANATLYYTIYGETGTPAPEIVTEAQTLFNESKMRTDKGVISGASSEAINITVSRNGGGTNDEIINLVADFFQSMDRGVNFESCFLIDQLVDTWAGMVVRVSPQFQVATISKYFVPVTTVLEIE